MNLICIAALVAVCSAAKLDRTYLPPDSAKTAGGSSGHLITPNMQEFQPKRSGLPKGAEENEFDGVVVEAAAPGTRASGQGDSGLGASRTSYGSTHSKVGEAAFKVANQPRKPGYGQQSSQSKDIAQVDYQNTQYFQQGSSSNVFAPRQQAALERASSTVRFVNNIGSQAYSYAYETENGIIAEESGTAVNGVQAEGGYSYTGDDGKLYKIRYTAGEGGYQPTGEHIPTPHPIPEEILRSLEQNAKEAAAGFVDDGSYDDTKYNEDGEYSSNDNSNVRPAFEKRPNLNNNVDKIHTNRNNNPVETSLNNSPNGILSSSILNEQQPSRNNYEPSKTQGSNQESINSQIFDFPPQNSGIDSALSTNIQSESKLMIGLTKESDKNIETNEKNDRFYLGDYSRPISFGPILLNQVTNQMGTKQSYLPPSNSFSINELSSSAPNVIPSRNTYYSAQQKIISRPQTSSKGNELKENNRHSDTTDPQKQSSNTLPNILSTMQPSPVLTLPFENSLNNDQVANSLQNQRVSSIKSQTINNKGANIQSTDNNLQIGQYDFKPGSYYQPSFFLNSNSKQLPTFVPVQQKEHFNSKTPQFSNPHPIISNSYQPFSTFNPNFDNFQGSTFMRKNEESKASTNYPLPPTLGLIVPTPTRPTFFNDDNVFAQHLITQASASPFPAFSSKKYASYNYSPQIDLNSNKLRGESNPKDSPGIDVQNIPKLNTIGVKETPSQQYDGEIYEYNKPTETLSKPTESDGPSPSSDFSQFGQKIKPSVTVSTTHQFDKFHPENEHKNDQSYSSIKESIVETKQKPETNSFQTEFNSQLANQEFNDKIRQPFGPNNNVYSTGHEHTTQSSLFLSGASPEVQTNVGYKNPFEFSSIIRPCCRGHTRTSITEVPSKNYKHSTSFFSQNANQRPDFENNVQFATEMGNIQSVEKLQSAKGNSQTFIATEGEQFERSRKLPNFNDKSGYHY